MLNSIKNFKPLYSPFTALLHPLAGDRLDLSPDEAAFHLAVKALRNGQLFCISLGFGLKL
jgi:hypothetical protein